MELARRAGTALWHQVSETLAAEIREGPYELGARLPTEQELMKRFGVARHTVRRAMAELETRGVVRVEQGRGTFVHDKGMIDYRLSERTRFSDVLLGQGREPSGRILREEEVVASEPVREALGLVDAERVHHAVVVSYADDVPLCFTHAYYPVRRFPSLPKAQRPSRTVSSVYAEYGIRDYVRLKTAIAARMPSREEARALAQPASVPVLAVRKIDVDPDGAPICYSETVWASQRVEFSIDNAEKLFASRA